MLRSGKHYLLPGDRYFWPWVGLYNSHLFHAYWLMTGDAFHVNESEYAMVRPPGGWTDESLRADTERWARRLFSDDVLNSCRTVHIGKGRRAWPNVNFHSTHLGRRIVAALDRLLIEAYGLRETPLLAAIRTMREGSAHSLWS